MLLLIYFFSYTEINPSKHNSKLYLLLSKLKNMIGNYLRLRDEEETLRDSVGLQNTLT